MTEAQIRKVALSLPGASRGLIAAVRADVVIRAGTKIFATMTRAGDEAMVRVRQRDKLEALLQGKPEIVLRSLRGLDGPVRLPGNPAPRRAGGADHPAAARFVSTT